MSDMKKVPISLIIDDAAPLVFVFRVQPEKPYTADGRLLEPFVPNSFLDRFCDVIEKDGIKGKYSVIPMPDGQGDMVHGLTGFSRADLDYWIATVNRRLAPNFAFCPEMLTHWGKIDLATMKMTDVREDVWAADKDRTAMEPYIACALKILRDAGIDPTGVTSPWFFGIEHEDEYAAAISKALFEVTGRRHGWYFCRELFDVPNARPWIALKEEGRTLVSIPGTIDDMIWRTMDTPETSDEYVGSVADLLISRDGRSGKIIEVLESGGWPVMVEHWQSMFSNGLGTGVRVLDEVAKRVAANLSDRVEWMRYDEIMEKVINESEK